MSKAWPISAPFCFQNNWSFDNLRPRFNRSVLAFTHLWWAVDGPAEDPLATDLADLHANRQRVLAIASVIVPGHGAPFVPNEQTPR